jgi:hypothetical protein
MKVNHLTEMCNTIHCEYSSLREDSKSVQLQTPNMKVEFLFADLKVLVVYK